MERLKDIIQIVWIASFVFILVVATFCIGFYFLGDEDDVIKIKVGRKILIKLIVFNSFLIYIYAKM